MLMFAKAALLGLSLTWKLRLCFGAFLSVLAVGGTMVAVSATRLHGDIRHLIEVSNPMRAAAFELEINAVGSGLGVAKFLHRADPSDRVRFGEDRQEFLTFHEQFKKLAKSDAVAIHVEESTAGELMLSVRDNGIGMAPEHIAVALAPFGQVDSGLDRASEGVGLGLPISKKLVELHGGTLTIESALGAGTKVTATFPAWRSAGAPNLAARQAS